MEARTLRTEVTSLRAFLADASQPYPDVADEARALLCQMLDQCLRAPDTAKTVCPRCLGSGEGDGDMRPLCWECDGTGEVTPAEARAMREHYRAISASRLTEHDPRVA